MKQIEHSERITEFLQSSEACTLFGGDFNQRAAILAFGIGGTASLPAIASRLGMSEAALIRLARQCRSKNNNLLSWLKDPRSDEFFGRSFVIKFEVLAHHMTGQGTLAEIARRHGVTKAAMTRHARRARELFGYTQS